MASSTLPRVLILLLSIISFVQHMWYWPQLPNRVATHWGIDGQPNDWMSRAGATVVLCGVQIGLPLFLLFVTNLASRLPDSMVSIPNRLYWLHAERRTETLNWMNRSMSWIAVLTSLFLVAIGHLTFIANKTGEQLQMFFFAVLLIAYLAIVFTVAGVSVFRFRLPQLPN